MSFCGVDEVAEIAYLSLKETSIVLVGVMDDELAGASFFDVQVDSFEKGLSAGAEQIIITSFKRGEALRERLLALGVAPEAVCTVNSKGEGKA